MRSRIYLSDPIFFMRDAQWSYIELLNILEYRSDDRVQIDHPKILIVIDRQVSVIFLATTSVDLATSVFPGPPTFTIQKNRNI